MTLLPMPVALPGPPFGGNNLAKPFFVFLMNRATICAPVLREDLEAASGTAFHSDNRPLARLQDSLWMPETSFTKLPDEIRRQMHTNLNFHTSRTLGGVSIALLVASLSQLHAATTTPDPLPTLPITSPPSLWYLGVNDLHPVHEMVADNPGFAHYVVPPNGVEDPIEPIGNIDLASLQKGLGEKDLKKFIEGYVDRIELQYTSNSSPPGFLEWLHGHPKFRRDFWLAISPQFDNVPAAIAVLDSLRLHDSKRVEAFTQLSIALAVVYDSADAIMGSRYCGVMQVKKDQFGSLPTAISTFDRITDPEFQSTVVFPTRDLPWPVLTHLVDLDVSDQDMSWAQKSCAESRSDVGSLYQTVPYDMGKLDGYGTRLGDRPYTMENVHSFGGICGDQAQFTSRVARCFGIPAMCVVGEGRFGLTSKHVWCGFLSNHDGRPELKFTGRYDFDNYYTGEVFDPQTRTMVLDRNIEMLYDGLSLNYENYRSSQVLARAAMKLASSNPLVAASLAKQAIATDVFMPTAWRVLALLIAEGKVSTTDATKWSNKMLGSLKEHPDLTMELLPELMAQIPIRKMNDRQNLYEAAFNLYASRPDLQIHLRLAQCAELAANKREQDALELALNTAQANAKEGSLILPLVQQIVIMTQTLAGRDPDFQSSVVTAMIAKIDDDFPKKRGDTVSQGYTEFCDMTSVLRK